MSEITDESFEGHKKALAVKRSEKPKKLGEETVKYWLEIRTYQYHFDRGKEVTQQRLLNCEYCVHQMKLKLLV